jgi:hypothetical protein
MLLPAVAAARNAAASTTDSNNMKQIGLALHNYASRNNGKFPRAAIAGSDGKPLLSWRVAILPDLGEEALYKQFKLDEPWDSPTNKPLLARMPAVFQSPAGRGAVPPGQTRYQTPLNERGALNPAKEVEINRVTDGTSNTVVVVSAPVPVPWTAPTDLPCDPKSPVPSLATGGSPTFGVLFLDGSVRQLPATVDEATFRALITIDGQEPVKLP